MRSRRSDDLALAQDADLGAAGDGAVADVGAGDLAAPPAPRTLAHLGVAGDALLVVGLEQADHGGGDVFEGLVDDLVLAELDALVLGGLGLGVSPS